jgi:outer membrane protein assembly factor BamB
MRTFWTSSLVLAVAVGGLAVGTSTAGNPAARQLAAPPTSVSSRYVVLGNGPVLGVGNTLYVGGVSRLGTPTGSAVVVSTQTGTGPPVRAPVSGGSVQAAIPDAAGGWYIGGTFTSVGGVGRPGLAHLLPSGMLDTAFVPPVLGQVQALALDAGRLYVGGVRALYADPWFLPALSALDPATGGLLPVSYPLLAHTDDSASFGVIAIAAGNGRLFAAFNGDNGIAAYDEGTGALLWSQPGTPSYGQYSGPAALALAGGKLLAGGQISTPSGPVNLEELDPATGGLVGQPAVDGPVAGMATGPNNAYVLVRSPQVAGLSVWKLGLSSGTLTRLAIVKGASAIALNSPTLYAAGQAAVRGDVRIYAFDTRQANPGPHALSPALIGGGVGALALQSGHLLIAGSFLGTGGPERAGLAAFDATTGALLPWNPRVPGGHVGALASSGKTIYLAGAFKRVSGKPRVGLAAVSALGTGKLLPWHPRLSQGSFGSLVVTQGRVFAGGSAKPHGAKASTPFRHLLVFSAKTGRRLRFDSRIGRVNLMAVGHRLVLAERSCDQGEVTTACISAFRARGIGRPVWRRSIEGRILALQAKTKPSTLYVGGEFSSIDGQPRANLAALALDDKGTLLDFAPQVPLPVTAVALTDYGLVFAANAFGAGSSGPYFVGAQALGAVSYAGDPLPWQVTFPPNDVPLSSSDTAALAGNFAIGRLAPVPDGLVARGDFSWLGPAEDPAPGSLVWLR